eukprot:403355077
MGLGMLIDFLESNEKKFGKEQQEKYQKSDLEIQKKVQSTQAKDLNMLEGQNLQFTDRPKQKQNNEKGLTSKQDKAAPTFYRRDNSEQRNQNLNPFDEKFEASTNDFENKEESYSLSNSQALLVGGNDNFSSAAKIYQSRDSQTLNENVTKDQQQMSEEHDQHCELKIQVDEDSDDELCCTGNSKFHEWKGWNKCFIRFQTLFIDFLGQRDFIIGSLKFLVGFFGLGYGIYNYIQEYVYSIQDSDLNYYRIFISAYLMIESLDGYFDSESQKSLDVKWRCKKCSIFKKYYKKNKVENINDKTQIKKNQQFQLPGFRSRFFQLIPTAFYAGFVISGFFAYKHYAKYENVDSYVEYENDEFNYIKGQALEKFKNKTSFPDYDYRIVNQTFNAVQSDIDSRQLLDEFSKEYITFVSITIMILAKNFFSILFPGLIREPHLERGFTIYKIKAHHIYLFIFGLLQAIIGVCITLAYGHGDILKLIKFDINQQNHEDWEISNSTKDQFSTGTESSFLLLHFIDEIVDYIPLFVVICHKNIVERVNKISQEPQDQQTKQKEFIESKFFKTLFISVFFINVIVFISELTATILILEKYQKYLNRKSPIVLFAATLGLEAMENLFDCLSCLENKLFTKSWERVGHVCRNILSKCLEPRSYKESVEPSQREMIQKCECNSRTKAQQKFSSNISSNSEQKINVKEAQVINNQQNILENMDKINEKERMGLNSLLSIQDI